MIQVNESLLTYFKDIPTSSKACITNHLLAQIILQRNESSPLQVHALYLSNVKKGEMKK